MFAIALDRRFVFFVFHWSISFFHPPPSDSFANFFSSC